MLLLSTSRGASLIPSVLCPVDAGAEAGAEAGAAADLLLLRLSSFIPAASRNCRDVWRLRDVVGPLSPAAGSAGEVKDLMAAAALAEPSAAAGCCCSSSGALGVCAFGSFNPALEDKPADATEGTLLLLAKETPEEDLLNAASPGASFRESTASNFNRLVESPVAPTGPRVASAAVTAAGSLALEAVETTGEAWGPLRLPEREDLPSAAASTRYPL